MAQLWLFLWHTCLKFVCVSKCVSPCLGGFAAVIYTDAIQTLIIVGGAFSLMFIGTAAHFSNTSMFPSRFWHCWSLCLIQPSPGWDGMKDLLRSTWAPLRLLPSQTQLVTFLVVTPSTCSGTRWREICRGQVWCLVSPYWQHGSGALIRWLSIFTVAHRLIRLLIWFVSQIDFCISLHLTVSTPECPHISSSFLSSYYIQNVDLWPSFKSNSTKILHTFYFSILSPLHQSRILKFINDWDEFN